MSDLLAKIQAELRRDKNPPCPVCDMEVSFEDPEFASAYTSYWGEDGPQESKCPHCGETIFISEHVTRRWNLLSEAEA